MNAFEIGFRRGMEKSAAMTPHVDKAVRQLRARGHDRLASDLLHVASKGVNSTAEKGLMRRLHAMPDFKKAVKDALSPHGGAASSTRRTVSMPHSSSTYHSNPVENVAKPRGSPHVEKANFVEGAKHKAKMDTARKVERQAGSDAARKARASSPHAIARKNPMVHVPQKPNAGQRAVSALKLKMKGMSGKQKALVGAAALAGLLGTGAAARHGMKPSYERLGEKPKVRKD